MEGIKAWVEAEGTGHWFFVAFPICLLLLLVWFKGRRVKFLIPGLLFTVIIINPLFYQKWDEMGLYAYWRLLWAIPVIPLLAAVIPSITEWIKTKVWLKMIITIAGVGLVFIGGTFLYSGNGGSFTEASNPEKLPVDAVQIADELLEMDQAQPRAIVQYPLCVYIRQYTGRIDTLYGRNIEPFILTPSDEAVGIHNILSSPDGDLSVVAGFMANSDYDYLVIRIKDNQDRLKDAGFTLVGKSDNYGIYMLSDVEKSVLD